MKSLDLGIVAEDGDFTKNELADMEEHLEVPEEDEEDGELNLHAVDDTDVIEEDCDVDDDEEDW